MYLKVSDVFQCSRPRLVSSSLNCLSEITIKYGRMYLLHELQDIFPLFTTIPLSIKNNDKEYCKDLESETSGEALAAPGWGGLLLYYANTNGSDGCILLYNAQAHKSKRHIKNIILKPIKEPAV